MNSCKKIFCLYFYLLQIQGLMLAVNEFFSADNMVRRYLFRLNPCKLYEHLENIFHTYLERIFHFWKQYFIPTRSVIVPCFSAKKAQLFNSLDLFSFDRLLETRLDDQTYFDARPYSLIWLFWCK